MRVCSSSGRLPPARLLLSFLLWVLIWAGCPAGLDPECSSDRDCGDHHLCLDGSCQDLAGSCTIDQHCLSGQVCVGGICISACQGDHHCPAEHWCDAGHCLPGCLSDADCPIGTLCTVASHTCDPGCTVDGHCPIMQVCRDGLCADAECLSDADCMAGHRCLAGLCQVMANCVQDADCPQGQRCIEAQCEDPECIFSADCEAGQLCTDGWCLDDDSCTTDMDCALGYSCVSGRCRLDGACASDADCPQGQRCADGQCVAGGCISDGDCAVGQHCLDGTCNDRECLDDGHCAIGQVCQAGLCQSLADCNWFVQDCGAGQKCSVDGAGLPACMAAGDGTACLAGQSDDCAAGMLCTGYDGFACHALCNANTGAGCPVGMFCSAVDAVAGLGTCQCDPLAQACAAGQRCVPDGSATPVCQPAGDGSQCFEGGLDDCPAGMLCATADGFSYDCFDICQSEQNCPPYHGCYPVDSMPNLGLCVGDCHPLRQDCLAGNKCTLDEFNSPICYAGVGNGANCQAGVADDCPAGFMCVHDGASWGCGAFCIIYNGIGCSGGQVCASLGSAHWGACI